MATEKLWMPSIESCYETDFNAQVIAIEENKAILDRTLFYPIGGGQNWDVGTLSWDGGESEVVEVRGRADVEHHLINITGLSVGDMVEGRIDWQRRHAHMRMHTAQHLVSGIVYEMFHGTRTVGNQIHHDRSRIDFNPIKFEDEMLNRVITRTNEMIESDLSVECRVMTRAEINKIMPPDRTNMDLLPISVKELRVVRVGDDVDLCPCAGTHVRKLSEIGNVRLLGKKSKGKGTQRISYTLEGLGDHL
ncbi:MAG: alanyl-tRNA editing protein [Candidatus Poseidoniaceae archaeon]|nr:alanyl-tRNA editing protein [Candidatus Poseidoniaceae archaeon]